MTRGLAGEAVEEQRREEGAHQCSGRRRDRLKRLSLRRCCCCRDDAVEVEQGDLVADDVIKADGAAVLILSGKERRVKVKHARVLLLLLGSLELRAVVCAIAERRRPV